MLGKCTSFPRGADVDCSHRINELDLEEELCEISVCDGSGICVFNKTAPECISRRSKGKAGVVAGAAAGAAVLLGVAAAAFFIARNAAAQPHPYGQFVDAPAGAVCDNPTFTLPTEHSNNLYA